MVAVDEQRVTVAVRDDDAERVAFAIVAGTVVPANVITQNTMTFRIAVLYLSTVRINPDASFALIGAVR